MERISRIIHYCWFGEKPLPKNAKKCINSWKIKEWNETNFDIHCCSFVEEDYQEKKWVFVADYARFYAMYTDGGVYLEMDSELIKPSSELLEHRAFFGFGNQTMTLLVFFY